MADQNTGTLDTTSNTITQARAGFQTELEKAVQADNGTLASFYGALLQASSKHSRAAAVKASQKAEIERRAKVKKIRESKRNSKPAQKPNA
jgi:hypothetical protein